jgi:hypothetical protein
MHASKHDNTADIIKLAERIKKILFEKLIRQHKAVISVDKFPKILENEAAKFIKENPHYQQ